MFSELEINQKNLVIMRIVVFVFFFQLICSIRGLTQCPVPFFTFTTQAEINAFPSDFPNCTTIPGLRITGANITNLDSLIQLTASIGSWGIQISNTNLMNLDGLSNITTVSGEAFYLGFNPLLTDISGIDNISNVDVDNFEIVGNGMLGICAFTPVCDAVINQNAVLTFSGNLSTCNGVANLNSQCINGTLPVHWEKPLAVGQNENSGIELNWTTSMHINHENFEIQSSKDAKNFFVIAIDREEYGTETISHTYVDHSDFYGTIYYRIRQNDQNGRSTYSNLASITKSKSKIHIYPNPVQNFIYINSSDFSFLKIKNQYGEIIEQLESNGESDRIDLSFISAGMYFVYINDELIQKLIKI